MFNWDTRYANLLKGWGKELEDGSVLEVGCGPHGIARYLRNNVTGLELEKIQPAVKNLSIVVGSVTEIPYPDNAFDYVICSDVLEHLPASSRPQAIAEIIRVSRIKSFIQAPHGISALKVEKMLAETIRAAGGIVPGWLREHLENGLPKASETMMSVLDAGYIPVIRKNEGMVEHYASVVLDSFFPRLGGYQGAINFKGALAEIRSDESDEPYSLLVVVDKKQGVASVADPFETELAPIADEETVRSFDEQVKTSIFSVHHKLTEFVDRFNLIKAFDVTGNILEIKDGLKEPKGFFEKRNDRCSEMSAIHYVWRNKLFGDIVGFCHYRRYLYLFPEEIGEHEIKVSTDRFSALLPRLEDEKQIQSLLGKFDLLTTYPQEMDGYSQSEYYFKAHYGDDYFTMVGCVIEKYPFLSQALDESMNSTRLYSTNILFCRKELFDVFCRIWFDILACCACKLDPAGRNAYQARDIAFLSERVFDTLIRHLKRLGYKVAEFPRIFVEMDERPKIEAAVSRNQPCPCGSGKRYKHCCGNLA